jgi:hypothetical protein
MSKKNVKKVEELLAALRTIADYDDTVNPIGDYGNPDDSEVEDEND